jgi:hypothetical protein
MLAVTPVSLPQEKSRLDPNRGELFGSQLFPRPVSLVELAGYTNSVVYYCGAILFY